MGSDVVLSTARALDPIGQFAASRHEPRALWYRPATGESLIGVGPAQTFMTALRQVSQTVIGGFVFDPAAEATALWDGFRPTRSLAPERLGLGEQEWKALVAEVAAGIRTGELGLQKVVLARAEQVAVKVSIDQVLRRLAEGYPSCTIFAFGTADAVFVGATPERLVALRNRTATTMALAGSAPRASDPYEDRATGERLLRDPKERTEHAVVLEALRESLQPLSSRVVADAEPRLERLPNVQHLITPVRAHLREGVGVLDVVAQLHPTPAVGGYPRRRALALIREREQLDRGWYAAPFGWTDNNGNGEFVVALRSALIRGDTATLFAGCGIVGDSDPDTEYAETGWKLRPMRAALGVAE
jgi:isochorismate synthase